MFSGVKFGVQGMVLINYFPKTNKILNHRIQMTLALTEASPWCRREPPQSLASVSCGIHRGVCFSGVGISTGRGCILVHSVSGGCDSTVDRANNNIVHIS